MPTEITAELIQYLQPILEEIKRNSLESAQVLRRKRKDLTAETVRLHSGFIEAEYGNRCPYQIACKGTPILQDGKLIPGVGVKEHRHGPHRNGLHSTCLVCDACNKAAERPEHMADPDELEAAFKLYQEKLKRWMRRVYGQQLWLAPSNP
jgi:hypothetical protein